MKKYSVFSLYVVEKDKHKFICKKILPNEYREVLTKEKIILEEKDNVEILSNYYSILERCNYATGQPLMVTKKDILLKYISINQKVIDKKSYYKEIDDFLKKQKEELEGWKTLSKECPELAKKEAVKKLQGAGILDENGNLNAPYNEAFTEKNGILEESDFTIVPKEIPKSKTEYDDLINLMYEDCAEIGKQNSKQKTLNK